MKTKTIKATSRSPKKQSGLKQHTARLVAIGSSRGIRLPKAMIEEAGLTDRVSIMLKDGQIIVASPDHKPRHPREGWEEQIKAAIAEHGNELTEEDREWLDAPIGDKNFDEKEWEW